MPFLARRRARGLVCRWRLPVVFTGSAAERPDLQARLLEHQVGEGTNRASWLPGHLRRHLQLHRPDAADECVGRRHRAAGARQAQCRPAASSRSASARPGYVEAPQRVRAALGWAATVADQNGVSIVARYGFTGPVQWKQLDTSKAGTPSDTMWVVRAPVCLDAACSDSIEVFTAHWGGGGSAVLDVAGAARP